MESEIGAGADAILGGGEAPAGGGEGDADAASRACGGLAFLRRPPSLLGLGFDGVALDLAFDFGLDLGSESGSESVSDSDLGFDFFGIGSGGDSGAELLVR